MKRVLIGVAVGAGALLLSGCKTKAYHDCVERGVQYHKEGGSYPKMTSKAFAGKDTQEIIESRCSRSVTAY